MTRAVSTVLDALLFLLLVSAAAATLTVSPGTTTDPDADAAATVVARSTASVEYRLTPRVNDERLPRPDGTFTSHARGRLAGLLARAATRNVTVGGRPVTHTGDGLEEAVADAVANATGPRTQVVAVWSPLHGASVVGRTAVGREPPPDATVASRTLTVSTKAVGTRERALAAANRSGYAGVAAVVADATVDVLLPADGMAGALAADYPTDRLAARRYRRIAGRLGVDVSGAVARENVSAANARLRHALAGRLNAAMRERYRSPVAAARGVSVGYVRIIVRRWSR